MDPVVTIIFFFKWKNGEIKILASFRCDYQEKKNQFWKPEREGNCEWCLWEVETI